MFQIPVKLLKMLIHYIHMYCQGTIVIYCFLRRCRNSTYGKVKRPHRVTPDDLTSFLSPWPIVLQARALLQQGVGDTAVGPGFDNRVSPQLPHYTNSATRNWPIELSSLHGWIITVLCITEGSRSTR